MDDIVKFINQSLKALYKNPDSLVFAPLAEAYRRQGAFQKAVQICESGLNKHQEYAPGYAVLGCIYFDLKKYRKSMECFEKALDLEPGHLLSLRYLSDLYIRFKEVKKALCVYEMLLLSYPQDVQVQNIVNKMHSMHLRDYDYFSERSLDEAALDLSQIELQKQPSIRPLSCGGAVELSKEDLLNQMLVSAPRPSQKKNFSAKGIEKDRKLKVLRDLMNQLDRV